MEKALYEPIRKTVEEIFVKLGKCHFEITADGRISNKLKEYLDDTALYILKMEKFSPDIMGYGGRDGRGVIVVEIKKNLKLKDIFQAKQYGEIFRARYVLVVYAKPLTEEIKRCFAQRSILHRSYGSTIMLAEFDEVKGRINEDAWYDGEYPH